MCAVNGVDEVDRLLISDNEFECQWVVLVTAWITIPHQSHYHYHVMFFLVFWVDLLLFSDCKLYSGVKLQPWTFQWDLTSYLLIWTVLHINRPVHQCIVSLLSQYKISNFVPLNQCWNWQNPYSNSKSVVGYTKSVVDPGQVVHVGNQAVVAVCVANSCFGVHRVLLQERPTVSTKRKYTLVAKPSTQNRGGLEEK